MENKNVNEKPQYSGWVNPKIKVCITGWLDHMKPLDHNLTAQQERLLVITPIRLM